MNKTFVSQYNGSPMIEFKEYITFKPENEPIINDSFYVNLNDVDPTDFFKVIMHNKFANKMPVKNSVLDRFSTHFVIKSEDFGENLCSKYFKALENITDTERSKDYMNAIKTSLEHIISILHNVTEDISKHNIYVDIYDSVISSSFIGIHGLKKVDDITEVSIPIFQASAFAEKIEKQDYQVSFSCKKDGIISASFITRPMCMGDIYFEPIPGSHLTIDKENVKVSYLGTEFDKEKFEDLGNLRIALDIFFTPDNGKVFKNEQEFDDFNDFIKYIKGENPDNKRYKINLKLHEIKITVEGNVADKVGYAEGIYNKVINYIKSGTNIPFEVLCEKITQNRIEKLFKVDDLSSNQFLLTTIVD